MHFKIIHRVINAAVHRTEGFKHVLVNPYYCMFIVQIKIQPPSLNVGSVEYSSRQVGTVSVLHKAWVEQFFTEGAAKCCHGVLEGM